MSEKEKKKISFYYFIPIIFLFFLTFFFTSISTVLSNYINYRISGHSSGIKIVGNIDNYISNNDKSLIININKYSGDESQIFYLNTFNPQTKDNKQVLIDEFIFNPSHNFKSYILGDYKNLIWLYNRGLNAYDIRSLKKVFSYKDIINKNPFLKNILEKESTKYNLLNNQVFINDGQNLFSVNLDTFTAKIEKNINFELTKTALVDTKLSLPLDNLKNTSIKLIGNLDKRLYLSTGEIDQKIKTNLVFRNGKFLIDTNKNKLLQSNNPDTITIIHDDKMSYQGNHFTISVVSIEGLLQSIMFQSDIGITPNNINSKVIIEKAHLNVQNQLVMITKNPESVFAFDIKNGSIIWKY